MESKGIKYDFSARAWLYSSSPEMCGWTFVSLPKEMAMKIRENFKLIYFHLKQKSEKKKIFGGFII